MSYYEYHVARRYVQFEGALRELPNYAALIGKKVLLLTACDPLRAQLEGKIREGLEKPAAYWMQQRLAEESPRYARYMPMTDRLDELRRDMTFEFYDIGDRVVSEPSIRQVADYVQSRGIDTVVGIGGGRGQDFARALTHYVPVKVILAPTLAATNASISTLSVLYSSDGAHIEQYWRMDNAPDLVLVDTEVLIRNGPKVLSAGVGDIVSTYYEALCNLRKTGRTDCIPALSDRGLQLAVDIMREQVPSAMEAVREQKINPAFESVVSMIMHNCGPLGMVCTLGFAHILDEMFLYFDAAHRHPHGLRVGFATIPMLLYQGAEDREIQQYIDFCHQAGIPVTLEELGLAEVTEDQWMQAYDATVGKSGTLQSLPFAATPEDLIDSLQAAKKWTKH
ncbi:MAG: iron-containing alcohol dehydrogenase [Eubacteriales bacterium]|nr:iron-containing alcohol dehydrogenase [Eubacteriales bacterium]